MSSSLPASLFLLSLVFWQFVSAAGQNNITVKAEPGDNVILPCESPDQDRILVAEWSRTDLGPESVLLYRNFQFDLENQNPSYRDRVDLLIGQIQKGDASLILKNTKTDDNGKYECHVVKSDRERKLISSISLVVAPRRPEPFPVWAKVLLVLALVAAAGVSFYFWLRWKPVPEQVEVESGEKFVKLPFKVPRCLWFSKYRTFLHVDKVEWKNRNDDVVHVYQNGSDQSREQNLISSTRTKMDENLLRTGDLSLTLKCPSDTDNNTYTCRVYNKNGEKLMKKNVWLEVKVQQVEVKSGVESVLLPWRTTEDLDGDVKVEWKDRENKTVHVYQNSSDQPGEQNEIYRTRTKMDENLKNKNLSLTLKWPRFGDRGIYTCRVYSRVGNILMKKHVQLQVKVQQVEVKSGVKSVLLPWIITEDLGGDVRVEWKDKYNKTVHVCQNGSDQLGEQHQIYKDRTEMDKNLLENKNLSLTLKWPSERDYGIYTCRVYRDKNILMMKDVQLKGKGTVGVQPKYTRSNQRTAGPEETLLI
ncbi:uncharacterized protein LOC122820815 [Gambusia affinis]|uniref:uncharacterized protein LOC122820815 n=1 Tax=Gambusia affinis TaxID=33528 RepID=UPI001CDCFE5B|nr:uncharacterized protein LOC122820815 [Gambusia affinis]